MNEEIRLILEANQLILRDRVWNNNVFEAQSKITSENISKILNPEAQPSHASRTYDALKGRAE